MTADLAEIFSFAPLRPLGDVVSRGIVKAPVREFRIQKDGEPARVFVADFIAREEKPVWEATRDAIREGVRLAEAVLRGTFELELLSINLKAGIRTFNPGNFSTLLVNHAKEISANGERTLRYTSGFFRLRGIMPTDWGKIRFREQIHTFAGPPEKLDLLLKKMLEPALNSEISAPANLILHDLSPTPVWNLENEAQQSRLSALLEKIKKEDKAGIRGCFYVNGEDGVEIGR